MGQGRHARHSDPGQLGFHGTRFSSPRWAASAADSVKNSQFVCSELTAAITNVACSCLLLILGANAEPIRLSQSETLLRHSCALNGTEWVRRVFPNKGGSRCFKLTGSNLRTG